jgi:hypothetical protein
LKESPSSFVRWALLNDPFHFFSDVTRMASSPPRVDCAVEWLDGWDESEAGWRPCYAITYEDGEEVHREQVEAYYDPSDVPGSQTTEETKNDLDSLAASRAVATGKPVIVTSFASSGQAHVADVEDGQLRHRGSVPITASPPIRVPAPPSRPRTGTRPRAPRVRRTRRATRAGPSRDDPDLDDEPPDADPEAGRRRGVDARGRRP